MNIVLMLIGVVVVYKILSVVYKKNWDKNLSSVVSFSNKTATKGDKIDIIETVVNAKKLPVFCMNVKFDIDRSFIFGQNDTNSRCQIRPTAMMYFHCYLTRRSQEE